MKRTFVGLALAICCGGLIAQTGRDAYRQAYEAWQQAQANVEHDAGTGGAALVPQVDRAAAAAEKFQATRIAYLKSSLDDAAQRRQLLHTSSTRLSPDLAAPSVANLAASELQIVARTVAKFAEDRDPGIQQLRQSLERERITLAALTESIQARQKTVEATSQATAALEQARIKTAQAFDEQSSQLSQTIASLEKEGSAWNDYYEKLAQAIQIANAPPPPAPVSVAPTRSNSTTPVPLARYVGAWTFPIANGIFHGAQPEFVDLVVHEQSGHVDGTLFGRFRLSPGSTTDPLIRFDFEGDLTATPTQKFTLVTSDKAQGAIELIPGPAFNLLEVNFLIDPQLNKIRAGNFILVKK